MTKEIRFRQCNVSFNSPLPLCATRTNDVEHLLSAMIEQVVELRSHGYRHSIGNRDKIYKTKEDDLPVDRYCSATQSFDEDVLTPSILREV